MFSFNCLRVGGDIAIDFYVWKIVTIPLGKLNLVDVDFEIFAQKLFSEQKQWSFDFF